VRKQRTQNGKHCTEQPKIIMHNVYTKLVVK
jgi:hypothetical protein